MAIVYGISGVTGTFPATVSKSTAKTFEKLLVADQTGSVTSIISKYVRTEAVKEIAGTSFASVTLTGGQEVLNATITAQVDEQLIESYSASTAPPAVRLYNPRAEASMQVLGDFTGSSFSLDSITFTTLSAEKAETAGDVVKTNIRGTAINTSSLGGFTLTTGDASVTGGLSTIRIEKRFSNTDYQRTSVTELSFSGT